MGRRTVVEVDKATAAARAPEEPGAPKIFKVGSLLDSIDRMIDHREQRLSSGVESAGVTSYYTKELKALRAAAAALTYHRATVERLPQFVGALRTLVAEVPANTELSGLRAARATAQAVLDEYESRV